MHDLIYDLKLICFLLLSAKYSTCLSRQRLCSRLTALWRYINLVLLLLFIIVRELWLCDMCRIIIIIIIIFFIEN